MAAPAPEIKAATPGYVSRLPIDGLDVACFERAMARAAGERTADPRAALEHLDEALGWWVAAASGTESKDAYCWPISGSATATVVWQPDGRLLVTSFDAPVGKDTLIPKWAKLVDVTTGDTQDVPDTDLGENARPSTGPSTNPQGQRLVKTGKDGNVDIALVGPSGSRTVFSVKDANPDWGILTGPTWSPDFEWFLTWDGTRLLVTTVDDPATTRVLASEASGGPYSYDVPGFSITERDYPGG